MIDKIEKNVFENKRNELSSSQKKNIVENVYLFAQPLSNITKSTKYVWNCTLISHIKEWLNEGEEGGHFKQFQ